MEESNYLMWLSRIEGIGLKKINLLLDHFKNAKEIYLASSMDLKAVVGITSLNIEKILFSKKNNTIDRFLEQLYKLDIKYISKFSPYYPKLLNQIYDAPIGLYFKGEFPDDELLKISVVGSRRCSQYGLNAAYNISKDLAMNNVVIVSGMARGIDTMSHDAALSVGGFTIAILGCGIDVCYPPENRLIREKIIENGLLISEFPPETSPYAKNFPLRNRIISGISDGTLVVEASEKSGTLITVGQALEQGRDVFAIPGNISSKLSSGTNTLIKDGAILVSNYLDILNEFNNKFDIKKSKSDKNNTVPSLAQEEKLVYDCISFEPVDFNFLIESLDIINQEDIQYILVTLELKGIIKKLPGLRYIKVK